MFPYINNLERYKFCAFDIINNYYLLKNSLRKGYGLVSNFVQVLENEFPHFQNKAILKEFAKLRTNIQLKAINLAVKSKKKAKMSLKAAKKSARIAGLL